MLKLVSILLLVFLAATGGASPDPEAGGRKVLACYYTWYATQGFSGSWLHWNEGGHDPTKLDPRALPDIGATHHPLELYDSADPAVTARHLALARRAGIDALLASWWGINHRYDRGIKTILKQAESSPVKIGFYYESIPGKRDDPDIIEKTVADFEHILTGDATSPGFFRYGGRPVIFIYSRALGQLSREQWAEVVGRIRARHAVCLMADSTDPGWLTFFDGLQGPVAELDPGRGLLVEGSVIAVERDRGVNRKRGTEVATDGPVGHSGVWGRVRRDCGMRVVSEFFFF